MSETAPAGTQPLPQHDWLKNLVGDWQIQSVVSMGPEEAPLTLFGSERCEMMGPLWVICEGDGESPGGGRNIYKMGLGYDVSFQEYRGFFVCAMSSHHWRYVGELSEDGRTMTLTCEGPDMEVDGKSAWYRDVHTLIDDGTREMRSYFQDGEGSWIEFQVCTITRRALGIAEER